MNIVAITDPLAIKSLLSTCDLPTADISEASPGRFFGILRDGQPIALIGLELYPPTALLRSLAVAPAWRRLGLGKRLVEFAESQARNAGISTLYLLTTTAAAFFSRLGYADSSRAAAPAAIAATQQFAGLCPSSSHFMSKDLASELP